MAQLLDVSLTSEEAPDQKKALQNLVKQISAETYEKSKNVYDDVNDNVYNQKSSMGKANCCSKFFFCWAFKYIQKARTEQMSVNDYEGLQKEDRVRKCQERLSAVYQRQRKGKRSLLGASTRTFLGEYCYSISMCMIGGAFSYASPFIVNMIIDFLKDPEGDVEYGFQLLGILIATQFFAYMITEQMYFYQCNLANKCTSSLKSMIYQKQLRLSAATNKKFGQGQIVNFVEVDAGALGWLMFSMGTVSQMPIVLVYCFAMLFYKLGLTFLSGVAVFVVAFVTNLILGYVTARMQKQLMDRKDKRMNATNEAINHIKMLKMYSWTDVFEKEIQERRKREVQMFKRMAWVNSFMISSLYFFPSVLGSVVFSTYIGTGHYIDLQTAFTVMIFFGLIQDPLRQFPLFISTLLQLVVSMRRIQEFLEADEIDQTKIVSVTPTDHSIESAISISKHSFSWGVNSSPDEPSRDKNASPKRAQKKVSKKGEEADTEMLEEDGNNRPLLQSTSSAGKGSVSKEGLFTTEETKGDEAKSEAKEKTLDNIVTLKDIDLQISKGELVIIIGDVGSGKSSLLQALIGEMLYVEPEQIKRYGAMNGYDKVIENEKQIEHFQQDLIDGTNRLINPPVEINGELAYVQQSPWIQNKTIRDNILYGLPLDKERYVDTIRLCELERDLEILPAGDQTEIGEKGINLSGGQKARIGLARAVYTTRDIFLMDDPISALDANVRKKIFMNVILDQLQGKTRLLVTHAIDFVHLADRIILMDKGRIVEQGPFEKLIENAKFRNLVQVNDLNTSNKPQDIEVAVGASQIEEDNEITKGIQSIISQSIVARETMIKESQVEKDYISHDQKMEMFDKLGKVTKGHDGKIVKNENEEEIEVTMDQYIRLLKFCGGWNRLIILQFIMIGFTICKIQTDYTIGKWANLNSKEDQQNNFKWYTFLAFSYCTGTALFVFMRAILVFFITIKGAVNVHNTMISRVIRSPINLFFDVTPSGTIVNRFSNDIQMLDQHLQGTIGGLNQMAYQGMSVIIVVCMTNWYMIAIIPFIVAIIYYLFKMTIKAFRETTRIFNVTNSPILNSLNESISGGSTIRAYGKQQEFIEINDKYLDRGILSGQVLLGTWCWYSVRMDCTTIIIMAVSATVVILFRETEDQVLLAMVFSNILQLQTFLKFLVYFFCDIEKQMVSIIRCFKFLDIPQEKQESTLKLPINAENSQWPNQGNITFEDVHLRYRPTTEQVLRGLDFDIQGGHKIGIVGRTGAGKSTISLAISRIVEIEQGTIKIDGLDIGQLKLEHLRQKVTVIPQDPTLFTGTLRFNIDPQGLQSDNDILELLERAGLTDVLSRQSSESIDNRALNGLDLEITENGGNLSSGEKQLICICRSILRKNKVVIMDEATANIDIITEQKIQELIKKEFKECTVITIAHRLQTIIESDKVLVLSFGKVTEFDSPDNLLKNQDSEFTKLVNEMKKEDKGEEEQK